MYQETFDFYAKIKTKTSTFVFKNNYLNFPHVIDRVYCELTQL